MAALHCSACVCKDEVHLATKAKRQCACECVPLFGFIFSICRKGIPGTTIKMDGHAYFPVADGYLQHENAREARYKCNQILGAVS